MAKVLIFGGTTEGRALAEYGARQGISVAVSVVSEYGKHVMGNMAGLSVRCGALDKDGIFSLLEEEKPCLVLDATHPHAVTVTGEIMWACKKAGVRCLRVVRDMTGEEAGESEDRYKAVFWVHTPGEAAEILARDQKPVLFTTGSKELEFFAEVEKLRGRIYARVLPDSQVLARCEQLGIRGKHLIAMQGPFSEEMNRALIREIGAGWLVTKESGSRGGFEEKLAAAGSCNIPAVVIRRPDSEEGISFEEACRELLCLAEEPDGTAAAEEPGRTAVAEKEELSEKDAMRGLSLIGMGMGTGSQLTVEAIRELEQCDVVLGAGRMLADIKPWIKGKAVKERYLGKEILNWLLAHPIYRRAAVVYSGDTGFYSGCGSLLRILKEQKEEEFLVRIFPGISTLSCLSARLGRSWESIHPASNHGRECDVEALLEKYGHVFLLLGGEEGLGRLCERLDKSGMGNVQVSAGVRLGYPDERIFTGTARELKGSEKASLVAVILDWDRSEAGDER